jgi:streptomycin 6-kinase
VNQNDEDSRAIEVPEVVRRKALAAGETGWLDGLPDMVAALEEEWGIRVGRAFSAGSEAYVATAVLADSTQAVLKVLIPGTYEASQHEALALRLADGNGCARLLREDAVRRAMLVERLGRSLAELALPVERRLDAMCAAVSQMWRPAAGSGLPTGAEKGRWLIDFISRKWDETGRPCSERAVAYALSCAERRIAAHDDERSVLVHGDVHPANTLEASDGAFKLIDPDGLLAEAEYDLGVMMREDSDDMAEGDPRKRAHWLAARTGRDAAAIWDWATVERLSTGLYCTHLELQPSGARMLAVAEFVAA